MLRPFSRSALLGATLAAIVSIPTVASAQVSFEFNSCGLPGVCAWVNVMATGSNLRVRVQNYDNVYGSALYSAQIIFQDALGLTSVASTATLSGPVTSIGSTPPNSWFFSGGIGGANVLDLASFFNVYIEGDAPSPFRASPGDPDAGTWVTSGDSYVEFNGDLGSIAGVTGGKIVGLGFCTFGQDLNCVTGEPVVVTPEPASMTLLATGLAGVVAARRRRKNRMV